MVAATSAEEKQTLLHAPESDRGSNPTRGSFARLAVAGSLVAGLALAGLASSGAVQGSALAPAGVFQLGAKHTCLLYTSPSPRDRQKSRMPSSA